METTATTSTERLTMPATTTRDGLVFDGYRFLLDVEDASGNVRTPLRTTREADAHEQAADWRRFAEREGLTLTVSVRTIEVWVPAHAL